MVSSVAGSIGMRRTGRRDSFGGGSQGRGRDRSAVSGLCVVDLGFCGHPTGLRGAPESGNPEYERRHTAIATRGIAGGPPHVVQLGVCNGLNPLHLIEFEAYGSFRASAEPVRHPRFADSGGRAPPRRRAAGGYVEPGPGKQGSRRDSRQSRGGTSTCFWGICCPACLRSCSAQGVYPLPGSLLSPAGAPWTLGGRVARSRGRFRSPPRHERIHRADPEGAAPGLGYTGAV